MFFSVLVWVQMFATFEIANAQNLSNSSGLPLPRFVSLRAKTVNMRAGPGVRYPVEWVYKRKHMPMEVVSEFGLWRRVRDFQGTTGWMHQSMLSGKRTSTVLGQTRTLRDRPVSSSSAVARLEPGTIGEIKKCEVSAGWCKLGFGEFVGWLRRVEIWGVYISEKIE
ncbi:MAG: SH3 domain-containing protein [Pseudomonadota bacterium]|nr:SH3 domain-containing protein [Pseudomonadota bacterium]